MVENVDQEIQMLYLSTIRYNLQTCRPRNTTFEPVNLEIQILYLSTIKYNIQTCRPVDQEIQHSNLSSCGL